MELFFVVLLLCGGASEAAWGFGSDDKKVLLQSVSALTLHQGRMTKGRRSPPVSQLQCVDRGSAPCASFAPRVVQCMNRGSDGIDAQWECTAQLERDVVFGDIDVSCEGFDYPDDPYVLQGSCGLKFTLDYARGGDGTRAFHSSDGVYSKQKSSWVADLIAYCGLGLIVYAFYKTCISPSRHDTSSAYSSTDDDYPAGGGGGGYGWNHPPPPPADGYNDGASCRSRRAHYGGGGMGGFWTGAATGGLLGYMFGNRGGNGWGGARASGGGMWGSGSFGGGGHSSGSSSGTHTASGFGGTSRR